VGRFGLAGIALSFVTGIACVANGAAIAALAAACGLACVPRLAPWSERARLLAALSLGILDALLRGAGAPAAGDERYHRFHATVLETTLASEPGRWNAIVRDGAGLAATLEGSGAPPLVGANLIVRGKRLPFDGPRDPGEPSQRDLEAERGVAYRIARATIIASAAPDPHDASLWIPRARSWASERLHATLPEPDATILAGAMWGERGTLPRALRAEFQDTGTVHVLVTAGLHLGVVAALALGFLRLLRCGRVAAAACTVAIVWLYAAFSGDHLPALRAATMLSFALAAYAAGREALSWNALAAAAIAIAAVRPASVTSVSFELSFSCVAALLAFAAPLRAGFERIGAPHLVAEVFAVSCAAQLGTWPLTAATFLVVAPYAPLANALVVPIVGVAMLAGFAALASTPLPLVATLVTNIATSLLDWIVACVRTVGELPGARIVATPPPLWTIAVYDGALATLALALARRTHLRPAVFALVCASALCLWPPREARHDLVVTAIDVGQADALLVQTPAGHAYLVDAGGRLERNTTSGGSSAEDVGERIVVPFLIRSGIHHVDAILMSHPHGDHVGGIPPVLRSLGAGIVADSGQRYPGYAYHDALDVAARQGVPIVYPRAGAVWTTDDGVAFRFYGPTLPLLTNTRNDINNNSLVFRLEYGHFRMLFTGDAGAEAEARILATGADVRADVLKVGHHGSAYSSTPEFIRAVAPAYAIISVGRDNLFGHPAASTIETLERAGARTYRTDLDGAVTVDSDGAGSVVRPFLTREPARQPP